MLETEKRSCSYGCPGERRGVYRSQTCGGKENYICNVRPKRISKMPRKGYTENDGVLLETNRPVSLELRMFGLAIRI
uniref:Uncharacterized protein n=1 Tax=Vespula pensylvanica TaxID=30213 RepID=A0A834KRU8_VESPE|nr:hypothetical protein H0235_012780 [Vespula pensylvanica]